MGVLCVFINMGDWNVVVLFEGWRKSGLELDLFVGIILFVLCLDSCLEVVNLGFFSGFVFGLRFSFVF